MPNIEAAVGKEFSEEQAAVWFDLLGRHDTPSLQAGIKRALLEREYPGLPPIALINRYATEHAQGVPIDAEQAFARVREAVSLYGYPEPGKAAEFVGPAIWSVIQGIGGWERICDSPIDQHQSLFAQFRDGWFRAAHRDQQQRLLPEDARPRQRIEGAEPKKMYAAVHLLATSMEGPA